MNKITENQVKEIFKKDKSIVDRNAIIHNANLLDRMYGMKIPNDYLEFQLNYGDITFDLVGGLISVKCVEKKEASRLNELIPLDFLYTLENGTNSILQNLYSNIPEFLLPVGGNLFGSFICLCMINPNYGKVYYWNNEEEDLYDAFGGLLLIANDFEGFIMNMQISNGD